MSPPGIFLGPELSEYQRSCRSAVPRRSGLAGSSLAGAAYAASVTGLGGVSAELAFLGQYQVAAALAAIGAHAVPGGELTDAAGLTHTRLVRCGDEPVAIRIGFRPDRIRLEVSAAAALPEATRLVRRWLDLDTDLTQVEAALWADPLLKPLVRARPGLRVVGYPDPFEAAVLTVVGQQISLPAGRTFAGRLLSAYGTPGPGGMLAFPTADRLAAVNPLDLQRAVGLTGARSQTVHSLAAACADGLVLDPDGDHAEIRHRLLGLRGIGPWTVDYLAVRVLGDRDAFPAGDLVLRRALGGVSTAAAARVALRWRPYRAYALFHLWSSAMAAGRSPPPSHRRLS